MNVFLFLEINTTPTTIVINSRENEYAMNLVFIHLSSVDFSNLNKINSKDISDIAWQY